MPRPVSILISKEQLDTLVEIVRNQNNSGDLDDEGVILFGQLLQIQQVEDDKPSPIPF